MKKMLLASVALATSLSIAGCNSGANTNAAAPANKAAPAAPAGNSAGGNSAGGGQTAPSGQQNFSFTNQSGQTITTLQVSPTGEASWGEDILGRDTLANGETTEIQFERGDDRCFWDVRATGEGGGELVMMNQNLCELTQITALPAE